MFYQSPLRQSRRGFGILAMNLRLIGTLMIGLALSGVAVKSQAEPSAEQRTGTFVIDGDKIFYKVHGSGFPVLLIHGFPLSSGLFEDQSAAYASRYKIITVDLPGFGRSSTATSAQTETHYATEMLALLDYLGIQKAAIGGHSMGGQVTLEMYRQQPQRFKAMILFDTNPAAASIVEKAEWPAYGRMAEKMGSASIAPSVVAVMVTGASIAARPGLKTRLTEIIDAATPTGVAGGGNALATRRDYTPLLGSITVPTLVVVGQDDTVYPLPVSQALAKAIPGSTLAEIPGAAHASMFQRPEATDAMIDAWIKTLQ